MLRSGPMPPRLEWWRSALKNWKSSDDAPMHGASGGGGVAGGVGGKGGEGGGESGGGGSGGCNGGCNGGEASRKNTSLSTRTKTA